jgi:hypothetical protein
MKAGRYRVRIEDDRGQSGSASVEIQMVAGRVSRAALLAASRTANRTP